MNNNPLPKNTVAKNRSSPSPIRSRTTPMNHKNTMPANGSRFKGEPPPESHLVSIGEPGPPASCGSLGTARRTRTNAVVSSTEKSDPGHGRRPAASGSPAW